ncbi:MAG: type II toxin-antitoxin system RelB/DinJ family antitoxin [Actinomycetes bacterium]|nr:type II toxin-antitoxin system RelB/DinJ family antitoxin [Actinomycetes bacterium]
MSEIMTPVTTKVPPVIKAQFSELTSELGVTPANAIRMFITAFVREGTFPFDVRGNVPNAETIAAIEEVERGEGLVGPFATVDEFMAALESDEDD